MPQRPVVNSCRSSGRYSPPMRAASSAATLKVNTARSTSARAVLMGLPASRAIMRANSSRFCWILAETARRISCRLNTGSLRVISNARTLAAIAASIWRGPASDTTPTVAPSYGDLISEVGPSSTQWPSMKSPRRCTRSATSGMRHLLAVGDSGLIAAAHALQRGFENVHRFVELLIVDHERHEQANDISVGSGRDGNHSMLITMFDDLLCLFVGRLQRFFGADELDGAHRTHSVNGADD